MKKGKGNLGGLDGQRNDRREEAQNEEEKHDFVLSWREEMFGDICELETHLESVKQSNNLKRLEATVTWK